MDAASDVDGSQRGEPGQDGGVGHWDSGRGADDAGADGAIVIHARREWAKRCRPEKSTRGNPTEVTARGPLGPERAFSREFILTTNENVSAPVANPGKSHELARRWRRCREVSRADVGPTHNTE